MVSSSGESDAPCGVKYTPVIPGTGFVGPNGFESVHGPASAESGAESTTASLLPSRNGGSVSTPASAGPASGPPVVSLEQRSSAHNTRAAPAPRLAFIH